jgi:hypothetical protein
MKEFSYQQASVSQMSVQPKSCKQQQRWSQLQQQGLSSTTLSQAELVLQVQQ